MSDEPTRLRRPAGESSLDETVIAPSGGVGSAPASADETVLRDAVRRVQSSGAPEAGVGSVIHDWYRLDQLLGVGAMGTVWKACDLQRERTGDPNPYVALKLVGEEFAQHELAMVAMSREAKKARELAHPNVATVFVFAVDPMTGQSYLAMELLDGQPLDGVIRDHPQGLPAAQALALVRGLARGLGYAHSKGIVHCDFKPGNAFRTQAGVPKVLDFGIARLAQAAARAGDNFDAGELSALTPAYASLEMLADGPVQPDPADDVYALGIVAYELLTGRHPFDGRTADAAQAAALKPRPIREIHRRQWHAIEKALHYRRADRWPDAQAFLRALDATGPWVPVLAALAVTLAVAAGYAAYQNHRASLPAQPLEQLPAALQARFHAAMEEGDYAFRFATTELAGDEALAAIYRDAVENYAEAYALHPRNPDADAALRRSLDFLSANLGAADREVRDEAIAVLKDDQRRFEVLATYEPLQRAIDDITR
jgi:serine/threonine protein kinase